MVAVVKESTVREKELADCNDNAPSALMWAVPCDWRAREPLECTFTEEAVERLPSERLLAVCPTNTSPLESSVNVSAPAIVT